MGGGPRSVPWGLPPMDRPFPHTHMESDPVLETSLYSAAHGWSLWDPSAGTAGAGERGEGESGSVLRRVSEGALNWGYCSYTRRSSKWENNPTRTVKQSTWGRRSVSRRGDLWIIPEQQGLCPSALTPCAPAGLTAAQGAVTDTLTDFGGLRAKHISAKM